MTKNKLNVAVVGATGAVGREMLAVLEEKKFPVAKLLPLASERSAGTTIEFCEEEITVEVLSRDSFEGIDIALFSAGGGISLEYAPIAAKAGTIVVDNSSAFRMQPNVPLIVPEVNGSELRKLLSKNGEAEGQIIANPNCSTIQLVAVLKPIDDLFGIERVVVSTYQSVSGAGQAGMDELWEQTRAIFSQTEITADVFPYQIAFNCIPQIDVFLDNGYTKEEMKVIEESRKILAKPNLAITATAVRVPVFSCHSESVNIETKNATTLEQLKETLGHAPGLVVVDDPSENLYPVGVTLGGTNDTYVGRIRSDESRSNCFNLWIVADNLRKGAALNAVEIAEIVAEFQSS